MLRLLHCFFCCGLGFVLDVLSLIVDVLHHLLIQLDVLVDINLRVLQRRRVLPLAPEVQPFRLDIWRSVVLLHLILAEGVLPLLQLLALAAVLGLEPLNLAHQLRPQPLADLVAFLAQGEAGIQELAELVLGLLGLLGQLLVDLGVGGAEGGFVFDGLVGAGPLELAEVEVGHLAPREGEDGLGPRLYLGDYPVLAGEARLEGLLAAGGGVHPAVVGSPVGGVHGLSVVPVLAPDQEVELLALLLLAPGHSLLVVPQFDLQVFEGDFLVDHAHQQFGHSAPLLASDGLGHEAGLVDHLPQQQPEVFDYLELVVQYLPEGVVLLLAEAFRALDRPRVNLPSVQLQQAEEALGDNRILNVDDLPDFLGLARQQQPEYASDCGCEELQQVFLVVEPAAIDSTGAHNLGRVHRKHIVVQVVELYALLGLHHPRTLLRSPPPAGGPERGGAFAPERTEQVVSRVVVNGEVILVGEDSEHPIGIILLLRAFNHYNQLLYPPCLSFASSGCEGGDLAVGQPRHQNLRPLYLLQIVEAAQPVVASRIGDEVMVGAEADSCGWSGRAHLGRRDDGLRFRLCVIVVEAHFIAASDGNEEVHVADSDVHRIDLPKDILGVESPLLRLGDDDVHDCELPVAGLVEVHDGDPAVDAAQDCRFALGLHPAAVELRKPLQFYLLVLCGRGDDELGQLGDVNEGDGGLDGAEEEVGIAVAAGGGFAGQLELPLEGRVAVGLPEPDDVVEAQGHHHADILDPEEPADGRGVAAEGDGRLLVHTLNCHYLPRGQSGEGDAVVVVVQAEHGVVQVGLPHFFDLPAEVLAAAGDLVEPHEAVPGGREEPGLAAVALVPDDLGDCVEGLFVVDGPVIEMVLPHHDLNIARLASNSISWRDIELHGKTVSLVVGVVAPGLEAGPAGVVGLEADVQLLLVLLDLPDLRVQAFNLLGDGLVVPRFLPGGALGRVAAGHLGAFGRGGEVVAVAELVELGCFEVGLLREADGVAAGVDVKEWRLVLVVAVVSVVGGGGWLVAVREVLAKVGLLPIGLGLFPVEGELEADALLLAAFGAAALVLVAFEEGAAGLLRLLPKDVAAVFVLLEGEGGLVVGPRGSLLGGDGGSVVEGLAFATVAVFVGRVVCVFGVFAENGLVGVSWLVASLRLLLLERSGGRTEAGPGLAVELAELGLQLVPHRVECHPVAFQLRLDLHSAVGAAWLSLLAEVCLVVAALSAGQEGGLPVLAGLVVGLKDGAGLGLPVVLLVGLVSGRVEGFLVLALDACDLFVGVVVIAGGCWGDVVDLGVGPGPEGHCLCLAGGGSGARRAVVSGQQCGHPRTVQQQIILCQQLAVYGLRDG